MPPSIGNRQLRFGAATGERSNNPHLAGGEYKAINNKVKHGYQVPNMHQTKPVVWISCFSEIFFDEGVLS